MATSGSSVGLARPVRLPARRVGSSAPLAGSGTSASIAGGAAASRAGGGGAGGAADFDLHAAVAATAASARGKARGIATQ